MANASLNNLCIFEGRMTSNQKYTQINGQNGPIDKASFSISVPRALNSQQRQDPNVKKVDFVNLTMIGPRVKTLQQYFPAGTPIKVMAHYTEYETVDSATGQKKYGHNFEVDDFTFTVSASQGQNNANNNGNSNNNYQTQQNYQQPQQQTRQQVNNQQQANSNFQMFGENEFPF